jgi:SnoaL-like domain
MSAPRSYHGPRGARQWGVPDGRRVIAFAMTLHVIVGAPRAPYESGMNDAITPQDLVTRYLQVFNETDARRRAAIVSDLYAEECSYIDPLAAVSGRTAISDFVGAVQQQFPGVRFVLAGAIDAHHAQARFTWHAVAEGVKEPVAIGFDVVVHDGTRIRQVLGFLDKAPAATP